VKRDVLIVGAGVAGTSVFLHLVDALSATPGHRVRSVRVVDPNPVGRGLAFGDDDPLLLCNTATAVNSLRADRPEDFTRYLRDRGLQGRAEDCVPRSWMARYCHDRFTEAAARAAAAGIATVRVPGTVLSVAVDPAGQRLRLSEGAELTADEVVLATGVQLPRVPRHFAPHTGHPRYLDSPYPAVRLRERLGRGQRVLVLGSHQSAVDAALLLCRDGHRTTMTSPSGQLPAVRVSLGAPEREFPSLDRLARLDPDDPLLARRAMRCVVEAVRLLGPRPLREQVSRAEDPVRRLAEETALVEAGVCRWPGVMVPVIEAVIALAAGLPEPRRQALLQPFDWFTGRYVTALTVVNARRLLAHFSSGALRLARAYPRSVRFEDGVWRVEWPGAAPAEFDAVVNATGFHPPQLHWNQDRSALLLSRAEPGAAVDHLEADLRIRRAPGAPPERVWVAGVGTGMRIPFANHLRNVTRQAAQVAGQITGL
jgi:uncharacterized NAD(P)/FAD-binding protein YdhS